MDTYSSNSILHHSNGKIITSNYDGNERLYDYNEKPKSVNYINNRYIDNTNHSKYLYNDKSFSKKDDTEKISKLWLGEENGNKIKNSTYPNKSPTSSKNNHYEKIKPFYNNRLEEEMRTQMEREMQHKEERKLVEEEVTSGTLKGNKNEKIVLVKKNMLTSPKNDRKNVSSFDTMSSSNSIIINLTGENGYGKYDNVKSNIYNNHNTTPLSPKSTPSTSNTISSKTFLAPRKDLVILKSPTSLKVPQNSSPISNNLKSEKNFFQLDNKESVINQMKNTLRKVSPPIEKTGMTLGRVIDNIPQQKVSPSSKNSESGISSDSSPSTSPLPPPPLFNNNGTFINKTFKNFSTSTDNYKKSPDHENIGKPKNPPPPPPPTGLGIKKLPTNNFESSNRKNKNQNSKNEQLTRDDLLAEIRNFGGAARLKRQA
uniref:WH2 domain-containing protein n=1 Tax=Strongyloides papillosus TaxID=174720 RepID=A0A0N5CBR8_STREA